MTRTRRRTMRLALAVAALAALAIFGGPWVYIHLIEGQAPAALAATSTTTLAPAAGTVEGTWTVGTGSQAGYRVPEVLGGQDTEAVGRTDDVTGQLTVDGTRVTAASFAVDLTTVASDSDRRDARFTGDIMQTERYPTATFTLTEPFDLGAVATAAGSVAVDATGTLELHGVAQPVTAKLTAVRSGDTVEVTGSIDVTFADFGVDNPSVGGFVTVGDTGIIEVQLQLARA